MTVFARGRRLRQERTGFQLYNAAVAAARDAFFYTELGVPDTLDGRFDLVGLHVGLVIRRLRRDETAEAAAVAQKLFDAMFADMDITLREIGVGDMSVAKRVRAMWEAFHGRSMAYDLALESGNLAELRDALARNVWRGEPAPGAGRLAAIVRAADAALAGQASDALLAGKVSFPSPAAA